LINEMSMTLSALSDAIKPDDAAQNACMSDEVLKKLQELTTKNAYQIEGDQFAVHADLIAAVESLALQIEQCNMGSVAEADDRRTVTGELKRVFNLVKAQSGGAKQKWDQDVFLCEGAREAQRRLLLRVIAREEKDIGYLCSPPHSKRFTIKQQR
jgi:hypothetical protein